MATTEEWDEDEEDEEGDEDVGDNGSMAALGGGAPTATADPLYAEPLLSGDEERLLFERFERTRDPALRDRLILANTRLVRRIADGIAYKRRIGYNGSSLTREDLEMEGMFGLMVAVERFEVARGHKFSTYATRWIMQRIVRAIEDQDQLIREPTHVQQKRNRARRRDEPDPVRSAWQVMSLDMPRWEHDPDSETWAESIPAPHAVSVEETATASAYHHATLYEALARLNARERYVIELRYGLSNGGDCWTLEAVGLTMNDGISRERVRQIEATALRKLRQALVRTHDGEVALRMLALVADDRKQRQDKARKDRMRELAKAKQKQQQQQQQTAKLAS